MIEDLNKKILGEGGVISLEDKNQFLEMKEQYEANTKVMVDMEKTFEQKVEEQKSKDKDLGFSRVDITKPHLVVLNEDPQLSHKLKYSLKDLPIFVGRKHGNPPPEITLTGIGIKINHATFEEFGNEVLLMPVDEDAKDFIFINGQQMMEDDGEILSHKDRITFGTNTIFLFMKYSDGTDIYQHDWESSQIELQREVEKNLKKREEVAEKKRQEEIENMKKNMELKFKHDKEEIEKALINEINHLKSQRDSIETIGKNEKLDEIVKKKMEDEMKKAEEKKREIIEKIERQEKEQEEMRNRKKTLMKTTDYTHKSNKLEQSLQNILRKLHKIKIIINEIRRNVQLEVVLYKDICEFLGDDHLTNTNILIRVNFI